MREDMPDKDITLGEVYRAVLSLKVEMAETRKEIHDGHQRLRDEVTKHGLAQVESEVRIHMLEARTKTLEAQLRVVESQPPQHIKSSDPWARIGAGISALATGALTYWMSRGGG